MADTIHINGGNGSRSQERPPRGEDAPRARTRASTSATEPASKPKKRTPTDAKLSTSIAEMYAVLGMGVVGIADIKRDGGLKLTGVAIVERSEAIADAWMDLADKNPKVKKTLQSLTEVSAVGAVVGIHIGCAMPLLMSRGIIPGFMVVDPNAPTTEQPMQETAA